MKITYFIRNNNNEYNELCSVASIKIVKNNNIYYAGGSWGEHTPTDKVESIVTTPEELNIYNWVEALGYEVIPEVI